MKLSAGQYRFFGFVLLVLAGAYYYYRVSKKTKRKQKDKEEIIPTISIDSAKQLVKGMNYNLLYD